MKPNFETLAVLFLAVLAIELRAGAQPPPPPVDYQTPPGVLTPGVSNPPVSPETPSAALAPSEYYGEDDSACYEGGNGWDAPYLGRRRGLGLRRWLGNRSGSAKLSGGWADFEALIWCNKGRHLPPLVTTSSAGTPQVDAAVIGLPNTSLLFGNDQVGREARIGGRLNVGLWLDPNWNTGLGYRATSVSGDQTTYDVVTDGSLIVGRPFYNVQNNARDALLIGFPGESSGDLHVRAANSFQMHDLFGRFRISDDDVNRVDFIAGYEYARIGDELSITDSRTFLNPFNPRVGVRLDGVDQFRVTNKFDGATLGLMGDIVRGRAKFSWLGKMGYGNMNEVVKISGSTVPSSGGTVGVPSIGGLYTQASNIGTYVENRRVFVPEFNFNLHLQMTQRLDFSIGYTFLYFSNVALAGDQVDRRVNQSQQLGGLVGQPFPIHTSNHSTDFWLQGLNLGLNGSF